MPAAYVQSTSGFVFTNTTGTQAFPSNVTAGNLICGHIGWDSNTVNLVSVTDNLGNSYTLVANPTGGGNGVRAAMFYAKNIAGGACTLSMNFDAAVNTARWSQHEASGLDTTAPLDKSAFNEQNFTGGGTDHWTSGSVTPAVDGEYIFGGTCAKFFTEPTAAGSGLTIHTQAFMASCEKVQGTAAAIAVTFTATNDDFITGIMTFKPAGGGGGGAEQFVKVEIRAA